MILFINIFLALSFAGDLIQLPKKCLSLEGPKCSVWNKKNQGYSFSLSATASNIYMKSNSIMSMEDSELELINGSLAVETSKQIEIHTSYARFTCSSCHAHFHLKEGKMLVQLAEGEMTFKRIDEDKKERIPVGFETTFFPVDPIRGKAKKDTYRPIYVETFVSFFDSFPDAEALKNKWLDRKDFFLEKTKEASAVYKEEALRQIAEEKRLRDRLAEQNRHKEAERQRLLKLYRQKNHLE